MKNKLISSNLKSLIRCLPVLKATICSDKKKVSLVVSGKNILQALTVLKKHTNFQFQLLTCISGVDFPQRKNRFKIVYELLSLRYNARVQVTIFSSESTSVVSTTKIFKSAGWYESEIWDMFGVFFTCHPNLTRLLTDYGFTGYPLRKDFPLSGFVESNYDLTHKQVLNNKIEINQEFKDFKFESPWLF